MSLAITKNTICQINATYAQRFIFFVLIDVEYFPVMYTFFWSHKSQVTSSMTSRRRERRRERKKALWFFTVVGCSKKSKVNRTFEGTSWKTTDLTFKGASLYQETWSFCSYLFRFLSLENRVTSYSTSSEKRLSCKLIYLRNSTWNTNTRKHWLFESNSLKINQTNNIIPCCYTAAATVSSRSIMHWP